MLKIVFGLVGVVSAKDFVKLTKRALKLGATAFDYSKRKK